MNRRIKDPARRVLRTACASSGKDDSNPSAAQQAAASTSVCPYTVTQHRAESEFHIQGKMPGLCPSVKKSTKRASVTGAGGRNAGNSGLSGYGNLPLIIILLPA